MCVCVCVCVCVCTLPGILLHGLEFTRIRPEQQNCTQMKAARYVNKTEQVADNLQHNIYASWSEMGNSGIKVDEATTHDPQQSSLQPCRYCPRSIFHSRLPALEQTTLLNSSRSQQEHL